MLSMDDKPSRRKAQKSAGATASGASPRSKPKPDTRSRSMIRFFLDVKKPDEHELLDSVKWLKGQRLFTPFIRDGLRLMMDLKARRTDVLFDLFDWMEGWIDVEIERRINSRMQDTNARLARVEAELMAMRSAAPSVGQGPRAMSVGPVAGPVDEDDDVIVPIKKATSDGKTSNMNFLNSVNNLQRIQ